MMLHWDALVFVSAIVLLGAAMGAMLDGVISESQRDERYRRLFPRRATVDVLMRYRQQHLPRRQYDQVRPRRAA
jgi:hypothetical protein